MNETRRLAFIERIPIRWGDMDAMGHVNATVYFRFMEQARVSWFDTLGPRVAGGKPFGIVVVSTSCDYRRAMTYPGTVEVKFFVGVPGGSSMQTFYEMRVDSDPVPYAEGAAMIVFIDTARQKPTRIPAAVRERLLSAGLQT